MGRLAGKRRALSVSGRGRAGAFVGQSSFLFTSKSEKGMSVMTPRTQAFFSAAP